MIDFRKFYDVILNDVQILAMRASEQAYGMSRYDGFHKAVLFPDCDNLREEQWLRDVLRFGGSSSLSVSSGLLLG